MLLDVHLPVNKNTDSARSVFACCEDPAPFPLFALPFELPLLLVPPETPPPPPPPPGFQAFVMLVVIVHVYPVQVEEDR